MRSKICALNLADDAQPIGQAPCKDIAPQTITPHQPSARLAHRVQPLQPQQAQGQFFRAQVDMRLTREQAGLR